MNPWEGGNEMWAWGIEEGGEKSGGKNFGKIGAAPKEGLDRGAGDV